MKNKLTIILGAGFSANAGLPLAKSITEKFNRDLRGKILRFGHDEWVWKDNRSKEEINRSNIGKDNQYRNLYYSYVFNELRKRYIDKGDGEFSSYEDFYQFVICNTDCLESIKNVFSSAKNSLINENPDFESHEHNPDEKLIIKILNYLISDLLVVIPKCDVELKCIYSGFINYIKSFEEIDIFTLNHDLLLEHLLNIHDLPFSKGFSDDESSIRSVDDVTIPIFTNKFKKTTRIYKLHGSIDFFQYRYYETNGINFSPTNDIDYILSTDIIEVRTAKRINRITQAVEQKLNFGIDPKFISGTKKTDAIKNDGLFYKLFEQYKEVIDEAKTILISGYSFSDEHINENLKSKSKSYHIINHNIKEDCSFFGTAENIRYINDFNDL